VCGLPLTGAPPDVEHGVPRHAALPHDAQHPVLHVQRREPVVLFRGLLPGGRAPPKKSPPLVNSRHECCLNQQNYHE